jgi:cellulose synthase/poly-beta-1,6-N-acetylglucosamine synthase-like glycosyltransferase
VLVALLPFIALARGIVDAIRLGYQGAPTFGTALSLFALGAGSLFFLYSLKYYLATLSMLVSSLVLGNGNGRANGKRNASHPHGLMRFLRRGNGNGHRNGNGNGHVDIGYEPFVSIHVATYNEKRVITRLLEGCAALEYKNYEVVVVDDSTDETAEILDGWKGRKGFKVVHRPNRDGFKGGALQVALQHTDPKAEYVIVWDADVVPFADSIQTYLPHFFKTNGNGHGNGNGHSKSRPELRPEVAAVQSYQWHVLNKSESWLTEGVRAEYAGSYMVERPFQEAIGSLKMVAGTAYMIRADILRELGWGRSLTEDWELTLRLYARGFKVVYTPYAETPAECAATFGRLARQRMRWAEGHSYNVRRNFGAIMGSRKVGLVEKLEFLFYSTYYLQSALFLVGSACWLIAEVFLRAHVPEWTATLGWSLLITNLLSLPLMNLAGLLLEEAPAKDLPGVLGALATSFLLIPFQGYAAIKGLFEKDEGPWYRTPKTGLITDPVHHLRRLVWLRRWLRGPGPSSRPPKEPLKAVAARDPRRRGSRLGWVVAAALGLALAGLGIGAINAPIANAAGTTLWLHGTLGPFTLDTTPPAGAVPALFLLAPVNATQTWHTTTSTAAAQTIFSTTAFTFNYTTTGVAGNTTGVTLTFAFSASTNCTSPTTIAQSSTTLTFGTASTGPFSPASNVVVPANSFFCFTVTVTSISASALTLNSDATSSPTNLASTDVIFIPELVLPFMVLAILAPLGARRLMGRAS